MSSSDQSRPQVKFATEPRTEALRQVLSRCGESMAADLLFLETWEADPVPGAGVALRVGQIRRANPKLAAAIRAELADAVRGPALLKPPRTVSRRDPEGVPSVQKLSQNDDTGSSGGA